MLLLDGFPRFFLLEFTVDELSWLSRVIFVVEGSVINIPVHKMQKSVRVFVFFQWIPAILLKAKMVASLRMKFLLVLDWINFLSQDDIRVEEVVEEVASYCGVSASLLF